MMKNERSREIKAGIQERAVDQRTTRTPPIFHEGVHEDDDLGHNERA